MNIFIPSIKQNLTCILLSALTGAVLATGVVVLLMSEQVGAMQLAHWQLAAIYVAVIAASVLSGLKSAGKKCADDKQETASASGNPESSPS